MNIVVTGAAGFIGSHLCDALLRAGHTVTGLDCFDDFYDPEVKRRNLGGAMPHPNFHLVEGDIRDVDCVERVMAKSEVDAVVHLAARAGVRPSIEQPLLYQDVNVRGTLVVLEACRQSACKLIFASSSSVYGNNKKVPFAETDPVDDPISPYAATKKCGELLCYTYHHLYGIPTTCLRFFTVYGPRQRPDLAIHKFTRLIESGSPIPVFGDGSMERDFTYIDDIIDGIIRAIDQCDEYRIYNLGESQPIALRDLVSALEQALGKAATIDRQSLQPGDVRRTFADVSAAKRDLGYQPGTDIHTGLARFVEWFRGAHMTTQSSLTPCPSDS